jgi:hypothetical protein
MKHLEQTFAIYVYNHYDICNILIYFCNICMKHLQYTSRTSETLQTYTYNMSGVLRNLITALMARSGLGGGGAKSTTDLVAACFFAGAPGRRSLEACAKYSMAMTPSRSSVAGGDE